MLKKFLSLIIKLFFLAFVLNLIWENLHAPLYDGYQFFGWSGKLIKSALWDAFFICLIYILLGFWRKDLFWLEKIKIVDFFIVFSAGLFIAWLIEIHGLKYERWAYSLLMPLVPLLKIGWTPFLQLAVTSNLVFLALKNNLFSFSKNKKG